MSTWGDSNNRYFYSFKSNAKRNRINSISDQDGVVYLENLHIKEVFLAHFKAILKPQRSQDHSISDLSHVKVFGKLSSDEGQILSRPVELCEITDAIKRECPAARWF